jgi:hypothetical protein
MFSGLLQAGTKALGGARFSLVNLFPTTVFVVVMATLITSGAYSKPHPSLTLILDKFSKSPGLAVGATLCIFLLAILLRPFQVTVVQFLEGYWRRWSPLEFANEMSTERHRRIQHTAEIMLSAGDPIQPTSGEFDEVAHYARQLRALNRRRRRAGIILERYPMAVEGSNGFVDRLMPTLLGNVLRDGEDYAGRRYGLDMPVIYPRIYPSLSPKLDKAISAQLDMLDTTSAYCVVFGLISLFTIPFLRRMDWWSLIPPVAALMSAFSYQGAIATARGHGRLLATAIDLHRFDMLEAMHYDLPRTPKDELDLNKKLSTLLESRDANAVLRMGKLRYKHPPPVGDRRDESPISIEVAGADSSNL